MSTLFTIKNAIITIRKQKHVVYIISSCNRKGKGGSHQGNAHIQVKPEILHGQH